MRDTTRDYILVTRATRTDMSNANAARETREHTYRHAKGLRSTRAVSVNAGKLTNASRSLQVSTQHAGPLQLWPERCGALEADGGDPERAGRVAVGLAVVDKDHLLGPAPHRFEGREVGLW